MKPNLPVIGQEVNYVTRINGRSDFNLTHNKVYTVMDVRKDYVTVEDDDGYLVTVLYSFFRWNNRRIKAY